MRVEARTTALVFFAALALPRPAFAMHLSDGILPLGWAALWTVVALPFLVIAVAQLRRRSHADAQHRTMVAMVAAAVFAISCMPVPVPLTGTCSHPCGTGLAAILLGPWATVIVAFVALLLQALFLAHGGLTTLGANVLSMGIAGTFVGYLTYRGLRRCGLGMAGAAFAAGLLSDWATYATTSAELALGLHGNGSAFSLFKAVLLAFVPTQLPLGILEGAFTAGAVVFLARRRPSLLRVEAQP